MTMEQRLEQVEQQNQQMQRQNQKIQRTNKRLTIALTMTVVAIAAVVTMAATDYSAEGLGNIVLNRVEAKYIWVKNSDGEIAVAMGSTAEGNGYINTFSGKGKALVVLGATVDGNGLVSTYQPNGKKLVRLGASDNGGMVHVANKTGESIAQMFADEYGNGVVGAYNRKGMGRTLEPGP